jgi:chromate transporter
MQGTPGSVTAAAALLLPPMFVAVGLLVLLNEFSHLQWLRAALEGIAAAAIGLTFSVGYRAARHSAKASPWAPPMLAAVFIAVGVLRLLLIPVVLCVVPIALLIVRKRK